MLQSFTLGDQEKVRAKQVVSWHLIKVFHTNCGIQHLHLTNFNRDNFNNNIIDLYIYVLITYHCTVFVCAKWGILYDWFGNNTKQYAYHVGPNRHDIIWMFHNLFRFHLSQEKALLLSQKESPKCVHRIDWKTLGEQIGSSFFSGYQDGVNQVTQGLMLTNWPNGFFVPFYLPLTCWWPWLVHAYDRWGLWGTRG